MSVPKFFLVALVILLLSQRVAAEGKCPPGYVQSPGPENGVINCMPLPGNEEVSSRAGGPRWASRWGAIAIDFAPSNVGIGVSAMAGSKRQAKKGALGECRAKGGQDCRINLIYGNQCAVVIAGIKYAKATEGPTVGIASAYALKLCEDAGIEQCQVYYKACSLPEQVP